MHTEGCGIRRDSPDRPGGPRADVSAAETRSRGGSESNGACWAGHKAQRSVLNQVAAMQLPTVRSPVRAALLSLLRLGAFLLGLAALAGMLQAGALLAAPQQPIAFNHQVHVKQMACVFCHRFYETREFAGRPEVSRCMLCHAYPVTKSPRSTTTWRNWPNGTWWRGRLRTRWNW